MAERTMRGLAAPGSLERTWGRLSPRLVPVLAIITAFIMGIPLMIFTSARGSVSDGLRIAGTAYSALIEGATGIVINQLVGESDTQSVRALAASSGLAQADLTRLSRSAARVAQAGSENVRRYGDLLTRLAIPAEEFDALGANIQVIAEVGEDNLRAMLPLIDDLAQLQRRAVRDLAAPYAAKTALTAEDRAALEAAAPSAAGYSDADLLAYMKIVNDRGTAQLERLEGVLETLSRQRISADGPETADIAAISALGAAAVQEMAQTQAELDAAGVTDAALAAEQLLMVRRLYDQGLLSNPDVGAALITEFDAALQRHLVVRRPGNQLLVDPAGSGPLGVIYDLANTPDDPSDDRVNAVYLRVAGSALLFFPANLENTFVRSIPFVIAGLAVALAFKAGLFNIGAEGQLYAGAMFAVWVGFSPTFAGLPAFLHLPLVLLAGLLGGTLWGAIPGVLKAYAGAHEVINTIMLNFIAIRLVDWMIKSTTPVIMRDPTASAPQTPYIAETARLPAFSQISPLWFILAGLLVAVIGIYMRRTSVADNARAALRPLIYGLGVVLGGILLAWLSVRGRLHIGLLLMVFAVWFTDWFLTRTTPGFELRSVGANPDAARYAGMSVPRNTILAMALSGMLAGLAGMVQVSGVQYYMIPDFFAGLGFDAIAVALLARTNPRNMILAGFLWGGMLTGAPLMQVNANISIDLVRIIQALIIMFVAADMIIRYLWRVPKAGRDDKLITTLSKGWGG